MEASPFDSDEAAKKREAFTAEALAAWREFQKTGLHATSEEVDQWLKSLGTDKELPPPECHK